MRHRRHVAAIAATLLGSIAGTALTPAAASATDPVFTVTGTGDAGDAVIDGVCATATGECTLRAAIDEANASPFHSTIGFALAGPLPQTIQLTAPLHIAAPVGLTIDGYTQPGTAPNTDPLVSNAVIGVAIRGAGTTGFVAIEVRSDDNVIRGIAVYDAKVGIQIYGHRGNSVVGSFVGTDPTGTFGVPRGVIASSGIELRYGTTGNHIGAPTPADRNVVSGNAHQGIGLYDPSTTGNVIQNNIVGLNPSGTDSLANRVNGIDINSWASGNVVGGLGDYEANLVSGNRANGIEVSHSDGTRGNLVIGNHIGTVPDGTAVAVWTANHHWGVNIEDHVVGNEVRSNIIGGNFAGGISIINGATGTVAADNWIGVTPAGDAIANFGPGIEMRGDPHDNVLGPGNVISGSTSGVFIDGDAADRNTITRNRFVGNTVLPIDLAPIGSANVNDAGDADTGPNEQLNAPVFTAEAGSLLTGTAYAACVVEVYRSDAAGTDLTHIVSLVAHADGSFSVPTGRLGSFTAATATDVDGNTSEMSAVFPITAVSDSSGGYWMLASDGTVYPFGGAIFLGDASGGSAVDLEPTPSGMGYWIVTGEGAVRAFGDAVPLGDIPSLAAGERVTSLSATPSGAGYWLFTDLGRVVPFGDAAFHGDMSGVTLNGPVLDSVATPTGAGYYLVASDGGVFAFGDAEFHGSTGDLVLNQPVLSLVPDPDGTGYWLVASDGGVFAFAANYRGSMPGVLPAGHGLNAPVIGMVPYGDGYVMAASDGGVFVFSDLPFTGSLGDQSLDAPVVSIGARP